MRNHFMRASYTREHVSRKVGVLMGEYCRLNLRVTANLTSPPDYVCQYVVKTPKGWSRNHA